MNTIFFSSIAIILYLSGTAWIGMRVFKQESGQESAKLPVYSISGLALLMHAIVLYQLIATGSGLNLGFYNALSLMSWVVALLVITGGIIRPTENLALVFLPAAALALLLELIFPGQRIITGTSTIGLHLHILLSVTAYSLLAMAAVQSIILAIQESQIHNKTPVSAMRFLPPLQVMEELLVQLLGIGYFLLSLSLASGLMFVHDILSQHLSHKVVLSVLAWIIFSLVLLGRWLRGWRGKILVRYTLGGFILLVLGYFGSKLVLELILQKV